MQYASAGSLLKLLNRLTVINDMTGINFFKFNVHYLQLKTMFGYALKNISEENLKTIGNFPNRQLTSFYITLKLISYQFQVSQFFYLMLEEPEQVRLLVHIASPVDTAFCCEISKSALCVWSPKLSQILQIWGTYIYGDILHCRCMQHTQI